MAANIQISEMWIRICVNLFLAENQLASFIVRYEKQGSLRPKRLGKCHSRCLIANIAMILIWQLCRAGEDDGWWLDKILYSNV